jgi:hypothetical protein
VQRFTTGKTVKKVIVVPKKLVNVVVAWKKLSVISYQLSVF